MLRELQIDDIPRALEIAGLKSRHSGTLPVSKEYLTDLISMSGPYSKLRTVGYFEDDVLISWLLIRIGVIHSEKAWAILGLYTSRFHDRFSWDPPELGKLIVWAFGLAEREGCTSYYYSIASRLERAYDHQWSKNPWLPPTSRYTREVVERVPANAMASQDWMSRLAGLPKPDQITILKRTLKT